MTRADRMSSYVAPVDVRTQVFAANCALCQALNFNAATGRETFPTRAGSGDGSLRATDGKGEFELPAQKEDGAIGMRIWSSHALKIIT